MSKATPHISDSKRLIVQIDYSKKLYDQIAFERIIKFILNDQRYDHGVTLVEILKHKEEHRDKNPPSHLKVKDQHLDNHCNSWVPQS